MEENQFDALERALTELESGKDLSDVISTHTYLDVELKTAQLLKSLSPDIIPAAAAHRSRTQVLSRAMQLRQESQSGWGFFRRIPRIAYALVLALVFLLSWNGLVYASAQALPGDKLYPAKLTLEKLRLGFALNPQTHQSVEEEYQSRRVDEVQHLLALGRVEFVQFVGSVEQQWEDYWIIEDIEVRLLPDTIIIGEIISGMSVEVEGATQPGGWLQASEIHLQNFSLTGTVEMISNTVWIISGQELLITSASQIDSDIQIGDIVIVQVSSDDFGTLTARSITHYVSEDDQFISTPIPERLDDEQDEAGQSPAMENEGDGDETGDKDDSGEDHDTPEQEESDKLDDPGDGDKPDDSDDSDEGDSGEDDSDESDSDEGDSDEDDSDEDDSDEGDSDEDDSDEDDSDEDKTDESDNKEKP